MIFYLQNICYVIFEFIKIRLMKVSPDAGFIQKEFEIEYHVYLLALNLNGNTSRSIVWQYVFALIA